MMRPTPRLRGTTHLVMTALQGLRARPLRTWITIAGQALATLALMVAIGGGAVTRSVARDSFDRLDGLPGTAAVALPRGNLAPTDVEALLRTVGGLAPPGSGFDVSAEYTGLTVEGRDGPVSVQVRASLGSGEVVRRRMVNGRWLIAADDRAVVPVVVVNRTADAGFGGEAYVRMVFPGGASQVVHVVGVVDDATDPVIAVSLGDRRVVPPELVSGGAAVDPVLRVRTPDHRPGRAGTIASDAATRALGLLVAPSAYASDGGPAVTRYIDRLQTIGIAVAVVMLIVAVLGVVNIGLATLRERSEELSLRRALGASSFDIVRLMLAEALMASVVAIVIAAVFSVGAWWVMTSGTVVDVGVSRPGYPFGAILLGALIAVAGGVAAAAFPAIRASRMAPAGVMRA